MVLIIAIPRLLGRFLGGTHFFEFLPAFCIGMIFAKSEFFEKWNAFWRQGALWATIRLLCSVLLLVGLYELYHVLPTAQYWDIKWGPMAIPVIVLLYDFVINIPLLSNILQFLGRHATNIFLVHTFIRSNYLNGFIYKQGNFVMTMVVLMGISLLISCCIEGLKKLLRYDLLINRMALAFRK